MNLKPCVTDICSIKLTINPKTLVVDFKNAFTSQPNPAGAPYQFALSGSGNLISTDTDKNRLDVVRVEAFGIFCTKSDAVCGGSGTVNKTVPVLNKSNPLPKSTTVSGSLTELRTTVPFSFQQNGTSPAVYPKMPYHPVPITAGTGANVTTFDWTPKDATHPNGVVQDNCNTGLVTGFTGDKCAPTLTMKATVTIYGTDTAMVGSGVFHGAGSNCDETSPTGQGGGEPAFNRGPKDNNPPTSEIPCVSVTNSINNNFNENNRASEQHGQPVAQCDANTEDCPCENADLCPGVIVIKVIADDGGGDGLTKPKTISFTGCVDNDIVDDTAGCVDDIDLNFELKVPKKPQPPVGIKEFPPLDAGRTGGSRTFTYVQDATTILTGVICDSLRNNSTIRWDLFTRTATVDDLGAADTVTCEFTATVL
jgi:hypothetical protein